jgi:5-methyltetrahydropteroyltriglutamate--homocysteine methyltransferase
MWCANSESSALTFPTTASGRENVIAGTDCGLGGRVHSQIAWAKLEALAKGAELASKELWG